MLPFSILRWTRLLLLFWPFFSFSFFFPNLSPHSAFGFPLSYPFLCTASNFAKLDVDTFLSLFLFPHSLFSHLMITVIAQNFVRNLISYISLIIWRSHLANRHIVCVRRVFVCVCVSVRACVCVCVCVCEREREREKWMMHVFCCHMHCFDYNKIAHCSWAHLLTIE